ncbi:MAG: hypothetical protein GF320_17195 [Armatimonadia bacterium]|nr:hypothetical protein [Armatimonadia bacterium]
MLARRWAAIGVVAFVLLAGALLALHLRHPSDSVAVGTPAEIRERLDHDPRNPDLWLSLAWAIEIEVGMGIDEQQSQANRTEDPVQRMLRLSSRATEAAPRRLAEGLAAADMALRYTGTNATPRKQGLVWQQKVRLLMLAGRFLEAAVVAETAARDLEDAEGWLAPYQWATLQTLAVHADLCAGEWEAAEAALSRLREEVAASGSSDEWAEELDEWQGYLDKRRGDGDGPG